MYHFHEQQHFFFFARVSLLYCECLSYIYCLLICCCLLCCKNDIQTHKKISLSQHDDSSFNFIDKKKSWLGIFDEFSFLGNKYAQSVFQKNMRLCILVACKPLSVFLFPFILGMLVYMAESAPATVIANFLSVNSFLLNATEALLYHIFVVEVILPKKRHKKWKQN